MRGSPHPVAIPSGPWRPAAVARGILLLALAIVLLACSLVRSGSGSPPVGPSGAPPTAAIDLPVGSLDPPPGMATITLAQLPPEALDTLTLIVDGGPFPYRQDGAVFENRERLLPGRPTGHYREFTVVTPGEDDRGARRIVTGADGERYWTDDHYDSFRWIVP